jgi:hypothetical protein
MTWGHFAFTYAAGMLTTMVLWEGPTWRGVIYYAAMAAAFLGLVWWTGYIARRERNGHG